MDLGKTYDVRHAAEQGAVMVVRDPVSGEPLYDGETPVTITLLGKDSRTWRKRLNAVARRAKGRSGGLEGMSDSESEDQMHKLLGACTTHWTGIDFAGDSVCTPALATKVFAATPWLVEQASAFMGERENFLGKASRGSRGSSAKSSVSG